MSEYISNNGIEVDVQKFEFAINIVNGAYWAEDYDLYERLLEKYAQMFNKPVWQFEDDCTDARLFGIECS